MRQIKHNLLSTKIDRFSEEIYNRNCKSFISLGRGGILITAMILAVGYILSSYTEFVLEYGLFFLYMLTLYCIARTCQKRKIQHIRTIYYLSITPIMVGGILMGSFLDPNQPAITIMILLCVLTLFIIDKPLHIFVYLFSIASCFAICCYLAKPFELFRADMIDLLIYFCISIGIGYYTLKDRVESAENFCMVHIKSERDTLTGLLNRGSGEKKSRTLVEQQVSGTFFILDIDNFKSFNDNYGHQVGDEVICMLAQKLQEVFRNQDVVFRLGGDEFAVYAPGLTDKIICKEHCERLCNRMKEAHLSVNTSHPIEVSIGCTIYHAGNIGFETLYKNSDELLYKAKNSGKGQMIFGEI